MHENSTGSRGFPFKIASNGVAPCEKNISLCRAADCGQAPVHDGLCAPHFEAFMTGSFPVAFTIAYWVSALYACSTRNLLLVAYGTQRLFFSLPSSAITLAAADPEDSGS